MKNLFKKIRDYIICFLLPKQVLKKCEEYSGDKEIEALINDSIIEIKASKNLELVLKYFNYELVYSVMEFFGKDLSYPLSTLNFKRPKDVLAYCRDNLIQCYTDGEKQQKNYFIETARFRFAYNYTNKDFSVEYILTESGKDY